MPEFCCLVCLYVQPRPGLDEDARAETEVLTVIDGDLVCVRHVGCASGEGRHRTLLNAVAMESDGEFTSLDAYQDWRNALDQGATDA